MSFNLSFTDLLETCCPSNSTIIVECIFFTIYKNKSKNLIFKCIKTINFKTINFIILLEDRDKVIFKMKYSIMFQVFEGGVSEPIKWNKDSLTAENNIIILDEGSSSLFLWYGAKQGLVSRRTALRQAQSLRGHGFTVGKSIVGRDIKDLKEIDQRKIGRVLEIDELNEDLQTLLNKEYKELDNFVITFELKEIVEPVAKIIPKPEPKIVSKPVSKPEPVIKQETPKVVKTEMKFASEYDDKPDPVLESKPTVKPSISTTKVSKQEPKVASKPVIGLSIQAKIGFVVIGILDHYDDIWISVKEDGSYSVEHMDGRVCEFSIVEGKIKFTIDSFSGISTKIKTEIQKKFVELSKLI